MPCICVLYQANSKLNCLIETALKEKWKALMRLVRCMMVALIACIGAGCASLQQINETFKRSEEQAAHASELAAAMRGQQGAPVRRTVVFSDEPIVAHKPLAIAPKKKTEPLNCTLTFAPAVPLDLLEFGQIVAKLCGFPIRVTSDALAVAKGQFASAITSSASSQTWARSTALPPLPTSSRSAAYPNTVGQSTSGLISNIKWNGKPLEGLLDLVTSRFGLSWRKLDRGVSIFYLDTKTFNFYAIPSTTEMQSVVQSGTSIAAGVSSGSGGESGGGGLSGHMGTNQTTAVALKTSITDDLAKNVQSMLTPSVGRMAISSSTGTLTVTDTPEVLARVDSYLQDQNHNLTKQVLLNVKVLAVTLTDKNSLGIDWNLVYQSLTNKFGLTFKSAGETDSSASSGAISILDTATGKFAGTRLIVQALSQQGRISMITSPSVTTLNLQPVPVQVARQISYLASVQTTNTAQVGVTTALTPATVTTGFNMNLLPYVMPDRRLLLQYSINLSALRRLRSVSSGDNTIEIPEIENRIFSQKVRLKSGETLVLSGFEQSIDGGNKSGVGEKSNILLGGALASDHRRDVVVVLITPIVLD